MNIITTIMLGIWAGGFAFYIFFGLLTARVTDVGGPIPVILCAAAWPILTPISLLVAYAERRAGSRQVPTTSDGDNYYDPTNTYTLVCALNARGITSTETATDEILTRTAQDIGLPAPTAAARARIRNLVVPTYPVTGQDEL